MIGFAKARLRTLAAEARNVDLPHDSLAAIALSEEKESDRIDSPTDVDPVDE